MNKINYIEIKNFDYVPLTFEQVKCPRCKVGTISKDPAKGGGKCKLCSEPTYYLFWKPMPSQLAVIFESLRKRTTPNRINHIGAMNTGKTDVDAFLLVYFALAIPGSHQGVLGLNIELIKRVIPESLDPFIMDEGYAKKDGKIRKSINNGYGFENGSHITFLPSDDDKKIRSMNVMRMLVIEGDKVPRSVVHALTGRLRQKEGVVYKKDADNEIVTKRVRDDRGNLKTVPVIERSYYNVTNEANPDINSLNYDDLLVSSKVYHTSSVQGLEKYNEYKIKDDPFAVTVLSATIDNPFVKEGYIEEKLHYGTPEEQAQNLRGEFVSLSDLVYKDYKEYFVEPIGVSKDYPTGISIDPGVGKDPTAMLMKCYIPELNIMYYFKEFYEYGDSLQQVASTLLDGMEDRYIIDVYIDPSAKKTLQLSQKTSVKTELESLIRRQIIPADNSISDGLFLVKSNMSESKLKFSTELTNLRMEFAKYSYKEDGKPVDRGNHLMDALRYNEQGTRGDSIRGIMEASKRDMVEGTPKRKLQPGILQNNPKIEYVEDEDFGQGVDIFD